MLLFAPYHQKRKYLDNNVLEPSTNPDGLRRSYF